MIDTAIAFSRYFAAFIFGMAVAVSFVGMPSTRKNNLVLGCYIIVIFMIQVMCLLRWGMDITWKIYPLIAHLPIAAFVTLYLKRSWLISVTTMLTTFLCCQPPRWIGSMAGEVFGNVKGEVFNSATVNHLGYILSVFLMYFILRKYVAKSVQHLIERSAKSCLVFGAVPAFYYFLDYATTVYTDFLYRGTRAAVQFMPFIISAFYFVFVLFYYAEIQKQARIERERDMLEMQFRQAQTEFASMRKRLGEIREYLRIAQSDMDAITPLRFCENDTVNLILSAFAAKAKQLGILLTIEARLPDTLTFSDTELCSLLSNALENAIHACEGITDSNQRSIKLRVYSKNNKLCIDIRNRYHAEPIFDQGLPVSKEQGHGFGTKSMAHIVEKHGGIYQFSVQDGWFIFQATA